MSSIVPNVNFFQKIGETSDGRVIYQIKDDDKYKKITIPKENQDCFEKLNRDIQISAEASLSKQISKENIKEIRGATLFSGIIGGGLGFFLARNKKTLIKTFSTLGGVLVGVGGAVLYYTNNLLKEIKEPLEEMKKLGIREYKE